MRKMIPIFAYIMTAIVCAFAGFATAALISANKHEEQLQAKQIEIDQEKHRSLLLERDVDRLIADEEKLENQVECLQSEKALLEDNNKKLSDVISRFRDNPNWLKERIVPGNTNWFALEPYTAINDNKSLQHALQQECETGLATGIRTYTDDEGHIYYCAALGSAYGRDLGDTWEVTLDNGESFNIIYADYKDDGKTEFFGHPCRNAREQPCTNVIEFIVEWEKLPSEVRERGSMCKLDWCDGNIIEMKYLGRVWE